MLQVFGLKIDSGQHGVVVQDLVAQDLQAMALYAKVHQSNSKMHLQASCMPRALPRALSSPVLRAAHAVGRHASLPSSLRRSGACIKCRRNVLEVSAVASAEPSTVKIITQGRHVEVTESLKKYVNDKVGKVVVKYEAAIKEVDVKLSVSGGDSGKGPKQQKTEITIYTIRNGVVRAEDVEESLYASIDLVADKVARKLRKMKEKAIARGKWQGPGGPRGGETIGQSLPSEAEDLVDELPIDQQPAAFPEIVRTKTFSLPPMTLEEALVQVEQVGHDFYLFRDKYTNQVRVLYKRKHSGYGVIVPQLGD